MPGRVKIWWHDGAIKDVRYNEIPVVNEPELGFEEVPVGAVAGATQPAPPRATVAIVETDVNVRYIVRRPGDLTPIDAGRSKPLPATGFSTDSIGVSRGCTIAFVEV